MQPHITTMNNKELANLGIEELKLKREEVLTRKKFYEELHLVIKTKIQDAKILAHTQNKYLPPSEFRALENKLKEHSDEVQRLQKLSGDINSEIKKKESFIFERVFVDICKERLSHDTWSDIFNEAKFRILKGA